jgi:hypothetical protein
MVSRFRAIAVKDSFGLEVPAICGYYAVIINRGDDL